MYPEEMVKPMRAELSEAGFQIINNYVSRRNGKTNESRTF